MKKKKLLTYVLKVLISIGLALAVFPFVKKLIDLVVTTESAGTIEVVYLITFVLIYSAWKEIVELAVKKLS